MTTLRKYRRRERTAVVAVRLDLCTDGFAYRKWGAEQRCKPGDWVVDNQGDVYTIDAASFARTYERVSPGMYVKTAPVWAERTDSAGAIRTREGETHYAAGDYLVYNDAERGDGYAVSADRFHTLYEALD
ncbi:MAG: hypothetical protein KDK91_00270 [Gammaproteobacteria bacterium]|nr:hypothetical protein [Gammaproteobacteria bacterium]